MIGQTMLSSFLIFLVFILCLFLSARDRVIPILLGSVFYLLFINEVWVLVFIILMLLNYLFKRNTFPGLHQWVLIVLNVSIWFILKAFSGSNVFGLQIIFPFALSIFILQQITFILSKEEEAKSISFLSFGAYSLFLGNISTGPIWNFKDFVKSGPFFYLSSIKIHTGIWMILFAFARKCIIVNNLANITFFLSGSSTDFKGNLLIPFFLSKYELYLNFLSFSEIAIGIGLLLGKDLPANFNHPFYTCSLIEFWKRWNITFVNWIREYVFYPLLLTPISRLGVQFLILITFVIFGLWHDFTWNHFIYGVLQFLLISVERKFSGYFSFTFKGFAQKIWRFIKWSFFYIFFLSVPALFFKLPDTSSVMRVLQNLISTPVLSTFKSLSYFSMNAYLFLFLVVVFEILTYKLRSQSAGDFLKRQTLISKFFMLFIYFLVIILLGEWGNQTSFIYSRY